MTKHANEQQVAQLNFELELPLSPTDEGVGSSGTEVEAWEKAFAGMM